MGSSSSVIAKQRNELLDLQWKTLIDQEVVPSRQRLFESLRKYTDKEVKKIKCKTNRQIDGFFKEQQQEEVKKADSFEAKEQKPLEFQINSSQQNPLRQQNSNPQIIPMFKNSHEGGIRNLHKPPPKPNPLGFQQGIRPFLNEGQPDVHYGCYQSQHNRHHTPKAQLFPQKQLDFGFGNHNHCQVNCLDYPMQKETRFPPHANLEGPACCPLPLTPHQMILQQQSMRAQQQLKDSNRMKNLPPKVFGGKKMLPWGPPQPPPIPPLSEKALERFKKLSLDEQSKIKILQLATSKMDKSQTCNMNQNV